MTDFLTLVVHSPATMRIGWTLLHSVWQIAIIAAALFSTLKFAPKSAAPFRYLAATTALLLTLFVPLITFQYLIATAPLPVLPLTITTTPTAQPPAHLLRMPTEPSAADTANPLIPHSSPFANLEQLLPTLATLWCVGVLLLSLYNLGGWIALQRLRALHYNPAPASLLSTLHALARKMQITRPIGLSQSSLITTPLVIGFLHPLILVPTTLLTGLSAVQLQAILAHELAHIRRHDYLVNLLQTLIETLVFYHPAVWWISAHIRQERENCCDDLAASLIGDPIVYAEALLSIEELRAPNNRLALAATGGHLFNRIQRLLSPVTSRPYRKPISVVAVLLALVLMAVFFWPAHQEPVAQVATTEQATTLQSAMSQPAEPEFLITGTLLETGTEHPVPAVPVEISRNDDSMQVLTDLEGHFSQLVTKGKWDVAFRQYNVRNGLVSEHAYSTLAHEVLDIDGKTSPVSVTLHIRPPIATGTIHGKVLMPDGSPASGILVVPEAEDETHSIINLVYLDAKKADSDGSFSFDTAPIGHPVHLYAEILKQHLAFTADIETRPNVPDQDVGTFILKPTFVADILITDAQNQPLANIDVNVQPTYGENGLGNNTRKFTTDDTGHLRPDGIVPGLHYKLHRPKAKNYANTLLLSAPPAAIPEHPPLVAILDDSYSIRVVDAAHNVVPVADIFEITVKIDTGDWRLDFQKPKIFGHTADGSVLVDPQEVILAHTNNLVTMRFTSANGLPMVATAPYPGNTSHIELIASPTAPAIELANTPQNVAPDEYAGRIIDQAGNPVTGSAISIAVYEPFIINNRKIIATTNADGLFRISATSPHSFYFQIDTPGFARRWFFTSDLPKGKAFEVRLDNTTRLQADIRLADNSPAAGATLTASTSIDSISTGQSLAGFQTTITADASGHIDLPLTPGTWELQVSSPNGQFARIPKIEIQPHQTLNQSITLAPGIHLKIRTLDSITNKPIPGATLIIATLFPAAVYGLPGSERTTDSQGLADWPNVMPGPQQIQIAADGYARWSSTASTIQDSRGIDGLHISLTPNMPEVTLTMEPGMRLTGKVLTSAGAPVPNARVNIDGLQTGDDRYARSTNANGEFSLLIPATLPYQNPPFKLIVTDPINRTAPPKATSEPFTPTIGGSKSFTLTIPNP